jgi:hypothetical protein
MGQHRIQKKTYRPHRHRDLRGDILFSILFLQLVVEDIADSRFALIYRTEQDQSMGVTLYRVESPWTRHVSVDERVHSDPFGSRPCALESDTRSLANE